MTHAAPDVGRRVVERFTKKFAWKNESTDEVVSKEKAKRQAKVEALKAEEDENRKKAPDESQSEP